MLSMEKPLCGCSIKWGIKIGACFEKFMPDESPVKDKK